MLSHGGVASVAEAARLAGATLLSGPAGGVAGGRIARRKTLQATSFRSTWAAHRRTSRSSGTARGRFRPSALSPATRSRCRAWTSSRSAQVADRSRAWTRPVSCGSARKARAHNPVPPATAAAVRWRQSRMRTSYSAISILTVFSAAACGSIVRRQKRPSTAWRASLALIAWPRRKVFIASSIRAWPRVSASSPFGAASILRPTALLSFGGAAGAHAVAIARQLGLKRVVVPRLASVLSAWGMLATSLRHELVRTHVGDTQALAPAGLRQLFSDMETRGAISPGGGLRRPDRDASGAPTCATASRSSRSMCP